MSDQNNFSIVEKAKGFARQFHADQVRRESGLPFFEVHLEPVAQMVAAHGGDAIAIAAAYLHDAPEDISPDTRVAIGALSPAVLEIVDRLTEEGETWEDRKGSYLGHIPSMDARSLLVSICDKIVTGYDFVAEWQQGKFGKRPARIMWFYGTLYDTYGERAMLLSQEEHFPALLEELLGIVRQLKVLEESKAGEKKDSPNSVPLATLLEWEPEIATRVLIPLQVMNRAEIDADPQATYNFFKGSAATLVGDNARNPALRKREYYDTVINEILAIIRQRDA